MNEKGTKIQQLEQNLEELHKKLDDLEKQNEAQADQISQLQNEKREIETQNRNLVLQLVDAKSGREEFKKIEELQFELDKCHQQYLQSLEK